MKGLLALVLVLVVYVTCTSCRLGLIKQPHKYAKIQDKPTCPDYPLPVPIPSNHPLLVKAFAAVDAYLQQQLHNIDVPGLMVSVVYDQDIVWHNGYGLVDPFNKSSGKPTIDSVVQIASISKVFTDIMLFQLRDAGKVVLDDYVDKYLPSFAMKNPYNTKHRATLRQTASHTAGLPREVPCDWMRLDKCTEEQILANLSRMAYITPPYLIPHYSNLGIALTGRALEKIVNVPYEDYVFKNILQPIGMTNSGFDYARLDSKIARGVAYLANGTRAPAPIEKLGWGNPMGGMLASARDMSKFMSFLFRSGNYDDGSQILDFSTVREILSPLILTADGLNAFGTPWEFAYDTASRIWIRSKAGELLGYRSQVATVPEIKLGVFTSATNGNADDETSTIFTRPILDILLPVYMDLLRLAQPKPVMPPAPQNYIGVYRLDDTEYNSIDFQIFLASDKTLHGSFAVGSDVDTSSEVQLSYEGNNSFRAIVLTNDGTCRWKDDGMNTELIYINMNGQTPTSAAIMGQMHYFVSKNCPSCK